MTLFRNVAVLAAIGCALLVAAPSVAQDAGAKPSAEVPQLVNMHLSAKKAMEAAMANYFDQGHVNMLHTVAEQQVIALTCPGFRVDPAKMKSQLDLIYDDEKGKPKTLSAVQKLELENKAMLGFGMTLGAHIVLAAYDKKGFCEAADNEKAHPTSRYSIFVAAN